MLQLFADGSTTTTTITPSGNFADPISWAGFVRETGIPAFFAIIVLVGIGWLIYKFGMKIVEYLLGPDGWIAKIQERMNKFLDAIEANSNRNTASMENQMIFCKTVHSEGGPCNVNDLREVGHEFAEMGRKLGDAVKTDVGMHVDAIHKALRVTPKA